MKPTFIILLFSFIATCSTFAQQSSNYVSGRVTDTNGEPLPGATTVSYTHLRAHETL